MQIDITLMCEMLSKVCYCLSISRISKFSKMTLFILSFDKGGKMEHQHVGEVSSSAVAQ